MKKEYFLLVFLVLNMLAFSTIIRADDYEIGVDEDEEIIWNCSLCDEDEAEDTLGEDWDDFLYFENMEQDKEMKIEITDVDDEEKKPSKVTGKNETALLVEMDFWEWKDKDNDWGSEDEEDIGFYFLADPEHYGEDIMFITIVPFPWAPVPSGEYFDDMDLYEWYDVDADENLLTVEIEEDELEEGAPAEDAKMEATYNERGILSNLKVYNKDDEVIIEFGLAGFIPGYNLPILLGIVGSSALGIIYIISKRK